MEPEQRYRLLQRARINTFLKRGFLALMAVLVLYYGIALVYATKTIYKVRKNYAVILEDLYGDRRVVDRVGWHGRLPFFTRLEQEVPLMNMEMYLGGTPEVQRIMSQGNVALWTSAMLTYRIVDLNRWGIENKTPISLLQTDYDGIVKDVMQSRTVDELISKREEIKDQIFLDLKRRPINVGGQNLEEKYGIEIVSFVLRDTRFSERLAEASEEKKRRELIAEAENYAADLEASRTLKLYAAYSEAIRDFRKSLGLGPESDQALFDFLNQQKWATAYEKNQTGQNTFVLNNSSASPSVVLPAPEPGRTKEMAPRNVENPQNTQSGLRQALGEANQAD